MRTLPTPQEMWDRIDSIDTYFFHDTRDEDRDPTPITVTFTIEPELKNGSWVYLARLHYMDFSSSISGEWHTEQLSSPEEALRDLYVQIFSTNDFCLLYVDDDTEVVALIDNEEAISDPWKLTAAHAA